MFANISREWFHIYKHSIYFCIVGVILSFFYIGFKATVAFNNVWNYPSWFNLHTN